MAKEPKKQKDVPSQFDILVEKVAELQGHVFALQIMVDQKDSGVIDRVDSLEDGAENQNPDWSFPEAAIRPGESPDIKTSSEPDNGLSDGELIPFEIEHGSPKTDVTADAATVTLRPTDEDGVEYEDADDVIVYVSNDREQRTILRRNWVKTIAAIPEDPGPPVVPAVPAVIGTILSFIRFSPETAEAEGVLVGEPPEGVRFFKTIRGDTTGGFDEYYYHLNDSDANPPLGIFIEEVSGAGDAKFDNSLTRDGDGVYVPLVLYTGTTTFVPLQPGKVFTVSRHSAAVSDGNINILTRKPGSATAIGAYDIAGLVDAMYEMTITDPDYSADEMLGTWRDPQGVAVPESERIIDLPSSLDDYSGVGTPDWYPYPVNGSNIRVFLADEGNTRIDTTPRIPLLKGTDPEDGSSDQVNLDIAKDTIGRVWSDTYEP